MHKERVVQSRPLYALLYTGYRSVVTYLEKDKTT